MPAIAAPHVGLPALARVRQKAAAIAHVMRLSKQYGTLLLMAPALWSLLIATDGRPTVSLAVIFITGAFIMRSAGCVLNDVADRRFDGSVARTKDRPLVSGRLATWEALIVGGVLSIAALGLALLLNPLALQLSIIGFLLAAVYPLTKRFFSAPQAVMGIAFGWGALLAWAAARNEVALPAWIIFGVTVCWAAAYDTIYALLDRDDDRKIGIRSTALLFGDRAWLGVGVLLMLALGGLIALGALVPLGPVYWMTLAGVTGVFGYQTWALRQGPDRAATFRLFQSHAGVGLLLLAGIAGDLMGS